MRKRVIAAGAIICAYILFALISPALTDKNAIENWNLKTYWSRYPILAPPSWVNFFGANLPPTGNISSTEVGPDTYRITYDFKYSSFPINLIIDFAPDAEGNITVNLTRPDGKTYTLYTGPVMRLSIGNNVMLMENAVKEMGLNISSNEVMITTLEGNGTEFLLGKKIGDDWEPLKGTYVFTIKSHGRPYLWVKGRVYGVMGTDNVGRDIWQAFLAGTRDTIFLVFATAFAAVFLGVTLGLLSGISGRAGRVVEGVAQVSSMLPTIPLIVATIPLVCNVSYYEALSVPIWVFILVITATLFGKIAQNVRTMVEVEASQEYIEAAKSLGAGELWILRKHVSRTVLPYAVSQFALVAAKTMGLISILGFFSVIPGMNWGSLMALVVTQKALYYGAWWMILPVGTAITLMMVAFIVIKWEVEERLNVTQRF